MNPTEKNYGAVNRIVRVTTLQSTHSLTMICGEMGKSKITLMNYMESSGIYWSYVHQFNCRPLQWHLLSDCCHAVYGWG